MVQLAPGVANPDDGLFQVLITQPHPLAEGAPDEGAEPAVAVIGQSPPNPFHCHRTASFSSTRYVSGRGFAVAHEDGRAFEEHLLPAMHVVRGNLPLEFALSKGGRFFKEWHIDAQYPI